MTGPVPLMVNWKAAIGSMIQSPGSVPMRIAEATAMSAVSDIAVSNPYRSRTHMKESGPAAPRSIVALKNGPRYSTGSPRERRNGCP